jgi:hypothetical protein
MGGGYKAPPWTFTGRCAPSPDATAAGRHVPRRHPISYARRMLQRPSSPEPPLVHRSTHITGQVLLTSPKDTDDPSWVRCAGHCTNCSSCRPRRCVLCCIELNSVAWLACPWPPANPINSVRATRKPIHLQRRADGHTARAGRTCRRASMCRTSCTWWRRSGAHLHAPTAVAETRSLSALVLVCVHDGCLRLTISLPSPCQMDARRAVPRAV